MENQDRTARTLVASALSFNDPAVPVKTEVIRHFLALIDTVKDYSDEIIGEALGQLQHHLEVSPADTPRFLLGVELVTTLLYCEGEKGQPVSIWVEPVLKQYVKILNGILSGNAHFSVGSFCGLGPLSKDDYELALDITHVLAVTTSKDSTGTINTLIRTIMAYAPEEVLKAKLEQLESPDFHEDRKEDRGKFYDIFVIAYLKRVYGMQEVMRKLRDSESQYAIPVASINWQNITEFSEEDLWVMLKRNCEITDPSYNQTQKRRLLTGELENRHPDDDTVKNWYLENFPRLVWID